MRERCFIKWTQAESDAICAEADQLLRKERRPFQYIWPEAQKVLPSDRQRPQIYCKHAAILKKRYNELRAAGPIPTPDLPPIPNGPLPEPQIIVVEKEVIVKELPDYGKIPTVTLARILLERLGSLEEREAHFLNFEKAWAATRQQDAAYDRRIDPRPDKEKPAERALRISIVGPLDSQAREIEERTKEIPRLQLRFFDKDHEGNLPNIVDYCIVQIKFCNHSWWEKAKAALPSDRVIAVDGGIQQIVQKIYDLSSRRPLTIATASEPPTNGAFPKVARNQLGLELHTTT